MAYDLKARLKELVEEDHTRARDKDILFRLVRKELEGKEQQVFSLLLSEYINHHVRRPTGARTRSARSRPGAAQLPAQQDHHRALIMESVGRRPLFLPSLVSATSDGWVAYDDMTVSNWREYISSRQRISRISSSLADWGSQNLRALHEYQAACSGKLPEGVRESLLRRMPQSSGRELSSEGALEVTSGA